MKQQYLKKCIASVLIACSALSVALADVKVPTCEEAATSMSGYGESGDCLYNYEEVKTLSVNDRVVTCQAVTSRECPYMPEENTTGQVVKFTAKYDIVTALLHEEKSE